VVYPPLRDCTCGKQRQHFPSCVHRRESEELRDQSKLPAQRNKHNGHHLAQRWRDEKAALHGDTEFLQICLGELQMGVLSDLVQSEEYFQKTQP
jgi:hypothetical protein